MTILSVDAPNGIHMCVCARAAAFSYGICVRALSLSFASPVNKTSARQSPSVAREKRNKSETSIENDKGKYGAWADGIRYTKSKEPKIMSFDRYVPETESQYNKFVAYLNKLRNNIAVSKSLTHTHTHTHTHTKWIHEWNRSSTPKYLEMCRAVNVIAVISAQ